MTTATHGREPAGDGADGLGAGTGQLPRRNECDW
jgi:hypothetical protein